MGRVEPLRIMMNYTGFDYEEINYSMAEWPSKKAEMPGGSMPVLEFSNGVRMCQTVSMARYIAKLGGVYPSDPYQRWLGDSLMEDYNDQICGPLTMV